MASKKTPKRRDDIGAILKRLAKVTHLRLETWDFHDRRKWTVFGGNMRVTRDSPGSALRALEREIKIR